MLKNISLFLLLLSVQVCSAQDLTGRKYSPSFTCLYKISFLNQTVEYGKRIGWDTVNVYSPFTGEILRDTIVWDTTFTVSKPFADFSCSSLDTSAECYLLITSCDGKEEFYPEVTHFYLEDVIFYQSSERMSSTLKKLCYLLNKFPLTYSHDIYIEITLMGVHDKSVGFSIPVSDKK